MVTLLPTIQLSQVQKQAFIEQGYVKLTKALSMEAIKNLREAVGRICANQASFSDISVIDGTNQEKIVTGIDNLCNKNEPIFLQLLGSPFLLSIAEEISGEDFFPVQEFAVLKRKEDNNAIIWHQDIITEPLSKTFMLGIYLDAANDENGSLRIIPQSHKSSLSICELQKMPYHAIEMEVGDILIHDLMLAHSSGTLSTFPQRRVVYFEFMSSTQAKEEQVYTEEMIKNRTSLLPLAMKIYTDACPLAEKFDWKHPEKNLFQNIVSIEEIYQRPLKTKPANYCFEF